MREAKLEKLRLFFDQVASYPKDAPLEQLAIICLRLVSLLSEDQTTIHLIAADLALVFESSADERVDSFLKEEFKQIDSELEASLRGFSALLDLVLQENTLCLDAADLLEQLPQSYQLLVEPFYMFIRRLDSYYDLSIYFNFSHNNIASILFIELLKELFITRFNLNKVGALFLVNNWLCSWVEDAHDILIVNFFISDQLSVINYAENKNIYAKEYVLAYLSVASSEEVLLEQTHIARLDSVLQEIGFFGIKRLLDAGFLGLEKPSFDNVAKIFRVV